MMRRLFMIVVCGLAPVFATHAQSEPPLSVELHVGTADGEPRLIWIPTRWTSSVSLVRLKRRKVGATEWEKLEGMQFVQQRDRINLEHAKPADYARLRQELLSDFTRAWIRGFGYGDELAGLPEGDYEYGVFVRVVGGDFLEQPVATAIWKQPMSRNYDVGLKPLGVFRDANGVQVQFAVDARRMLAWAVGVRVIEERNGLPSKAYDTLLIPATRDGWTSICHRPKEPMPTSVTFRLEDQFGDWAQETVQIVPGARLSKPTAAQQAACMPVRPSPKPVYKLPPAKLSNDIELIVGAERYDATLIWIPKTWPAGMEGVQIMRRGVGEPWKDVERVKRPSDEFRYKLEHAKTPADFARIREELRSGWRAPLMGNFGIRDVYSDELPDGVVEYGAFPVISGKRSAEPAATVPWLVGIEMDADFGLGKPRLVRDKTGLVAVIGFDAAKFKEKGGNFRLFQVTSDGNENLYAQASASASPIAWKHLCVPVHSGRTKAVKVIAQNMFGTESIVSMPIDDTQPVATDAAATAQCFVPPPVVSQVVTSRPMPPPPPAPATPAPVPQSTAPSSSTPSYLTPSSTPVDAAPLLDSATLWLDAAEGVSLDQRRVAAWRDKSGHGFIATMKDPNRRPTAETLSNGIPAIHFGGGQSLHLERPIEMSAGTLFIIGRSGGHQMRNIILGPVGNNNNNQLRWEDAETALIVGPYQGSNIVKFPVGDTSTLHVLAVRYDGTRVGFWRNGRPSNAWVFAKPPSDPYTFNSIGSFYSQMYLHGDIVAIILLPQALTRPELEAVDRTLREQYRVP